MIPTSPIGTGTLSMPVATAYTVPTGSPGYVRHLTLEGDYAVDADTGQFVSDTVLRQLVTIGLMTIKGSSGAAPWLGLEPFDIIDETIQDRVEIQVRTALAHIERRGLGRIERVDVTRAAKAIGRIDVVPIIIPRGGTEPLQLDPITL